MHDRAIKQAPAQLATIDLTSIESLLDVGGGSGAYSMEFINRKPELVATVFDLNNVVSITKSFIEREGYSGKIKTFTGDYTKDALPDGFDLVFLSAIIHSNSLETNQDLIQKCFHALNKSGKIVIQDWIMNNDRTQPTSGAVFAINMLVGTDAGDCFTEQEVADMLTQAGFKNISRIEFESGLSQVIAQKI
jgi:SAM-dependent methyltransferase